jgi:hypothetical protein
MMHIGRGGTGNVAKADTECPAAPAPGAQGATGSSDKPASPALLAADKGKDKENLRKIKSRTSTNGDDANDDDVAVPARKPEEIGWAEKGRNLLFGRK